MKFKLYREYGALNSPQVFNAFELGLKALGHEIVNKNEDVSVIWSVLWHGRMASNLNVYHECKQKNRPLLIIEVGNFKRNITWRICLDHINGLGEFANDENLDADRPKKLGIELKPFNEKRKKAILIATQHNKSLQWEGMPTMSNWVSNLIETIQRKCEYPIYIRPHPRCPLPGIEHEYRNVFRQTPQHIRGSYDDFDIDYDYHVVINHNSGPPIHAAIAGTPVICDSSSLAHPVSCTMDDIKDPYLPNREDWLIKLSHAEWTLEEISNGIPVKRLEKSILKQINS